uniref:Uncharacterized protein n=1 Tax=Romanomermis culicivorax TaxID=13658 RepID=A0A915LBT8_ROMCU
MEHTICCCANPTAIAALMAQVIVLSELTPVLLIFKFCSFMLVVQTFGSLSKRSAASSMLILFITLFTTSVNDGGILLLERMRAHS